MTDNLSDLRSAHADGLPYVALWPVDGFDPAWHAAQLAAGTRVMPSVRLPDPDYWQGNTLPPSAPLQAIAAANVPLILRTNNIRDAICSQRNRPPLASDALTKSASLFSVGADGTAVYTIAPNTQKVFCCDCLAPADLWKQEGAKWTQTKWYQALKQYIPSPPYVILVENNEGSPYEQLGKYVISGGVLKPYSGVQTGAAIRTVSARMANLVESRASTSPDDIVNLIDANRQAHYREFFAGFGGANLTAQYGGATLNMMAEWPWSDAYMGSMISVDAASPNWYINSPGLGDFTNCKLACVTNPIPAWEQAEARNPKSWRELSIQITNGAAIAGAIQGKHRPIRPTDWSGYCEWLLWAMQSPTHRTCVLRHYELAATKPTQAMFGATDAPALAAIGASDMASLTVGDYVLAEAAACDRICSTDLLRDFWLNGTPIVTGDKLPTDIQQAALHWPVYPLPGTPDNRGRLLPCDVNDPTSKWTYNTDTQQYTGTVRVWTCATKHPDGRVLVYAWTACQLGVVNVTVHEHGTVQINFAGKPSAYAVYGPVQPWGWKQF